MATATLTKGTDHDIPVAMPTFQDLSRDLNSERAPMPLFTFPESRLFAQVDCRSYMIIQWDTYFLQ
jgi:hypothetical protein